ncbi:MAG: hypothetical protein Q9227_005415 [Pyrenula ochraceoflavens]
MLRNTSTISAPAASAIPMTRRRSSKTASGPGPFSLDHGPISPLLPSSDDNPQLWSEQPSRSYTCSSSTVGHRIRTSGLSRQHLDVQDLSPFEYCAQIPGDSHASKTVSPGSYAHLSECEPSNCSQLSLPPNYEPHTSPLTPTSDAMTFASTAVTGSEPMSRSVTNDITCGASMLRLHSASSCDLSSQNLVDHCNKSNRVDSQSVDFSPSTESFFYPPSVPISAFDLSNCGSFQDTFLSNGNSEEAVSTDSEASAGSSPPSQARTVAGGNEKITHGKTRLIKPKMTRENNSSSGASEAKMVRLPSADGKTKEVMPIPKATYQRPVRQKTFCPYCTDHNEGFHGDHELRRHIDRVHSIVRKVWVCKDISPDGKFLANCKACRNKKTYGANYNAAAHLRRTHFFPCKKGRGGRGKGNEKRGGKGGGDKPSMEVLKHWMYQKDEYVLDKASATIDQILPQEQQLLHNFYEETADGSMNELNVGDQAAPIELEDGQLGYFDENFQLSQQQSMSESNLGIPVDGFPSNFPTSAGLVDASYGDPSLSSLSQSQYQGFGMDYVG